MSESDTDDEYGYPTKQTISSFEWNGHQYDLVLREQHIFIRVSLKMNGIRIGYLKGNLIPRPNSQFFAIADGISQELHELSVQFCNRYGRAERVEELTNEEAIRGGGFLHLYIVELQTSKRGNDLGLAFVLKTMHMLQDKWTLAVVVPGFLSDHLCKWSRNRKVPAVAGQSEEERDRVLETNQIRLIQHFARLGFKQAGRSASWFVTKPDLKWLTQQQARNIEIKECPTRKEPTGIQKRLADMVSDYLLSRVSLQSIEFFLRSLSDPSPVINESWSMHVASANVNGEANILLLNSLLRLGGNANHGDGLGNTPLHIAAASKNALAVKLLIRQGAQTSTQNLAGNTPLQCLQDQDQDMDDLAAAMGMKHWPAREVDVLPKLHCIQALLPTPIKSLLVEGWLSPRMRELLLTTAEIESGSFLDQQDIEFQRGRPVPISQCCGFFGIRRVDYIPPHVFEHPINQGGLYKSFHDGWGMCIQAIAHLLRSGHVPSVQNVHRVLSTNSALLVFGLDFDYRKVQHFLDKGGKTEYAVDAVLNITQNVVVDGDDGWEYVMFADDIEALPATPLDTDFDVARIMCINQGGGQGKERGPYRETLLLGLSG